ncbi:MAG: asparagine synthase (glutamine-hydrolyzing) [Clostridia bacterium]|nr:asparagine synthase (glutamine-hydrolyzing) [Clostridia bacterium]
MGGIAGWIDARPGMVREEERTHHIEKMAGTLAHRGGGRWATWADAQAGLAQLPGPVCQVRRGNHRYAAVCDAPHIGAELILAAYLEAGEKCVELLEGGFAFIVWDGARRRAFAARDAFGARPLFYAPIQDGAGVLLASEPKALFAHPQCVPGLTGDGLREVLSIGPGRTPGNGVFRGVREIPPGACLRIDGGGPRQRFWYRLRSQEHTDTPEDTVAHTRALLLSAIRRQWPADGDACALLSGGLDSSVITAVASGLVQEDRRLATYSFDYVGNGEFFRASAFQPEQDAPYADKVRAHCGTAHQALLCDDQELIDALIPAMRARDLPGMADVDASLLFFCGRLAQEQRVALSGECADEVFGGYPWFYKKQFLRAHTFPWNTDPSARLRILEPGLAASLRLEDHARARYEEMLAQAPRLPGEPAPAARRREIAYLNLYGFMATLMERSDRMSAAAGFDIRTPFCDRALIEYVFNVPWELKALGGEPKGLLRAAAEGLLPHEILHRRKSPFPKTHNPRYERLVRERVAGLLADPASPARALLNVDAVEALCAENADYGKPWFGQLMAGPQLLAWILQLNAWMETYGLSL